jgi:hypothetical protein
LIYPAGRAIRTDADSQFSGWLLQSFLEQHNAGLKKNTPCTEQD